MMSLEPLQLRLGRFYTHTQAIALWYFLPNTGAREVPMIKLGLFSQEVQHKLVTV